MNTLWHDLRFALRTLRKAPVFAAVAVLSLALGMGANTAVFSLLDQALLRLMPVHNPRELALLTMVGDHYGSNWGSNAISYPMYRDFRDHNAVFSGMFCRFPTHLSLTFNGQTERVAAELVSGSYFPVLGVGATAGRTFTPRDNVTPNGHPLVMLSYAFWKSRFAGDLALIGKTVVVNGHNMTVAGVAQPGFQGLELESPSQIFVPVMMKAWMTPGWDDLKERRSRWVNAFGRLKPGVTLERAKASLQPFFHGILEMEVTEPAFRNASSDARKAFLTNIIDVRPGSHGHSNVRGMLAAPLWVLLALTGGVLLIACANVASLLLARAAARRKEMAVRLSLGAGRWRIVRQLLVESLLLSLIGGLLGLALAAWTGKALLGLLPSDMVTLQIAATPDSRILAFTLAVAMLTGVLFGLAPALQSTRCDLAPTLKDQAGAIVGGSHVRLRKGLVAAQVALSLLLLIGAGLFVRSLSNLRGLGPGFSPDRLVAFNIAPDLNGYNSDRAKIFYQQLTANLSGLAGVESAGIAAVRILEFNEWDSSVTVEGYHGKDGVDAYMNQIGPGYFATLGVPLLAGRDFTLQDTEEVKHGPQADDWVPAKAIVNRKFATSYFGTASPIGRHIGFGADPGTKTDMEIVGVVKDIKYTNLRDEIPVQMFVPYLASRRVGDMTVYVRTRLDPKQAFNALRAEVRRLDPNLPLYAMRTEDEQVNNSLLIERLTASLSAAFGFLATLLAAIGLYGVMAYTVARRTREIGIRVALGALTGNVIWLVMREVLLLIAVGVAMGLPSALALTRLVRSQLYGIAPADPLTLAIATLGLAAVACLAGYIPALRAARVDPMRALRYE